MMRVMLVRPVLRELLYALGELALIVLTLTCVAGIAGITAAMVMGW